MKFPVMPNTSVNRSKDAESRYVLIPIYLDWGILAIDVKDIPSTAKRGAGSDIKLSVRHAPLPCNYPHSEIVYSVWDEDLGENRELRNVNNRQAQIYIRREICRKCRILKQPAITKEKWMNEKISRMEMKEKIEAQALAASET